MNLKKITRTSKIGLANIVTYSVATLEIEHANKYANKWEQHDVNPCPYKYRIVNGMVLFPLMNWICKA